MMIALIRKRLSLSTPTSDQGFSMVELLVYASLSVVILTISGSMLIMSITTRMKVTDLSQMSSTGQLIAISVQEGVRNASGAASATTDAQRAGIKQEATTATGQLLRARVAVGALNGDITWRCQAWFYSPVTESVYSAVSDTGKIDDPVGFTVSNGVHTPTAGSTRWNLLGEGVQNVQGIDFFGVGSSNNRVTLRFFMQRQDVSLVLIPSTIVKRSLVAGGTGPEVCY